MELHKLIYYTDVDAVKALVQSCPESVNKVSPRGVTPLIAAIEAEDPGIVRFLLEHGADINAWGAADCPPLHMAIDVAAEAFKDGPPGADQSSLDIVQILLGFGADIHALDSRGKDALAFAKWRHKPSYQLLVDWCRDKEG